MVFLGEKVLECPDCLVGMQRGSNAVSGVQPEKLFVRGSIGREDIQARLEISDQFVGQRDDVVVILAGLNGQSYIEPAHRFMQFFLLHRFQITDKRFSLYMFRKKRFLSVANER